jgi:threonine dehydrogenase-like Zn-dependent dehydrogenase
MRATVLHAPGEIRIENVPDAEIVEPTDALVRVVRACICGSDLWPYSGAEESAPERRMGHEAVCVVEEVGAEITTLKPGDVVAMPFACSDGSCEFCHEGLNTACVHVCFFGTGGAMDGAQAEALRIPLADGTLYKLPVGEDDELMPSLLTLADVMGTGHHAAVVADVRPGKSVAVVGDGAVGLCGVIAARRLGAEQIIILGRHEERTSLARELGATDVVPERGEEGVERVRERTGARARTRSSSASASTSRWRPRSASPDPAARSDAWACRSTKRSPRRSRPSSGTSRSAAVRLRSAPTSTSSCPTSSMGA